MYDMLKINWIKCSLVRIVLISSTLVVTTTNIVLATDSYDFIVVGAGAGGCVVARRLCEKHTVLLLEAGGDPDPNLEIPANANIAFQDGSIKLYMSTETNAGLATNGTMIHAVGHVLGGGTAVNGMMWNRGSPHDYDNWAQLTQNSSWSYKEMLKYFKKIEDYHGIYPLEEYHGKGGLITISHQNYAPGLDTWLEAGHILGYPNSDPNEEQVPSFTPIENNHLHGRRVSSYYGYIKPILGINPNLTLIKNAKVTRIYFHLNKAIGVEYVTKEGSVVFVNVLKEVVLSAGAYESPAILLRSGIGPLDVYGNVNINIVSILPVGHNLHDHVAVPLRILLEKDKVQVFDPQRDLTPETFAEYENTGDGPYSCYYGITAQALLVSSVRAKEPFPNSQWPDVHIILYQSAALEFGLLDNGSSTDVPVSLLVVLTRPKSRHGRLVLNTTDINSIPVFTFRYLTHPDDMEALLSGVEQAISLIENSSPYKRQGARVSDEKLPFCRNFEFRSTEYWKCYIKYMSFAATHVGGTCRMGRGTDDPNAVVDPELRVIGIENVRVADASIMPVVTNANTMAPTMAIGEKAAAMILNSWDIAKH